MLEVYIAKNNGFCKGVENAVRTAREISGKDVYILGDLIYKSPIFMSVSKYFSQLLLFFVKKFVPCKNF